MTALIPLDPLEFDVGVAPSDWVAWSIQFDNQKSNRKRRLRGVIRTIAIVPLVALVTLFLLWAFDPHRVPLGYSLRFAFKIIWQEAGFPILLIWTFALAGYFFRRQLVGMQMRAMMKGEPSDPETVHVRFGTDGISFNEPHIPTLIGWRGVKRWEESETHFFVVINALRAIVIPKRDLTPGIVDGITTWLKSHAPQPQ
jgi:YcxB-like protein